MIRLVFLVVGTLWLLNDLFGVLVRGQPHAGPDSASPSLPEAHTRVKRALKSAIIGLVLSGLALFVAVGTSRELTPIALTVAGFFALAVLVLSVVAGWQYGGLDRSRR